MPGKLVLVVDDNEDARDMARTVLEEQGYQVITSPDGKSCMREIVVRKPDLVVLDVNLPNISGLSTLDMMRVVRLGRPIPVVIWSGEGDDALRAKAENLGADDFVSKSTPMPEFARRVAAHLFMMEPKELAGVLATLSGAMPLSAAPAGIAEAHRAWQPYVVTYQDMEMCVLLGPGVTREAAALLPAADAAKKLAVYCKAGATWRRAFPAR